MGCGLGWCDFEREKATQERSKIDIALIPISLLKGQKGD